MSALAAILKYLPAVELIMGIASEFMGIINAAVLEDRDLTTLEIDRIDQLVADANQAHAQALTDARDKLREQEAAVNNDDPELPIDPAA